EQDHAAQRHVQCGAGGAEMRLGVAQLPETKRGALAPRFVLRGKCGAGPDRWNQGPVINWSLGCPSTSDMKVLRLLAMSALDRGGPSDTIDPLQADMDSRRPCRSASNPWEPFHRTFFRRAHPFRPVAGKPRRQRSPVCPSLLQAWGSNDQVRSAQRCFHEAVCRSAAPESLRWDTPAEVSCLRKLGKSQALFRAMHPKEGLLDPSSVACLSNSIHACPNKRDGPTFRSLLPRLR